MAISEGDAACTGVMGVAGGAGGADRGDGHHAHRAGRDGGVMGIVRLSRSPGREACRQQASLPGRCQSGESAPVFAAPAGLGAGPGLGASNAATVGVTA